MRLVSTTTRRRFLSLAGAGIAVALAPGASRAHDGPHRVEVGISAFAFTPRRVTIRAGDTVVWTNRDLAPHTATADEAGWETDRLDRGQSAAISFETPGRHAYFCSFHPMMTGEVVVEPT